jgi:site-specific DNA-methyltransferase (adenine-specific)
MLSIVHADARDHLAAMAARGETVHSIVTDPPYGLVSVVKRFGAAGAAPARSNGPTGVFKRASARFMGQQWDGTAIEQDPEFWKLCLGVLPPGGHMLAFSSPRTFHRVTCAIEDAGFEIRNTIMWLYASGFPKSHNQGDGWGTDLKPAWDPIILARKPLEGTIGENLRRYGVGALNIDGCRVPYQSEEDRAAATPQGRVTSKNGAFAGETQHDGGCAEFARPDTSKGRWPANVAHEDGVLEARFFFTSKASRRDRGATNNPPTVKPHDLLRWLVRLVTPLGGTVLDPFAGSGSTGKAARAEGMNAILIEKEARYVEIMRSRPGVATLRSALERLSDEIDNLTKRINAA